MTKALKCIEHQQHEGNEFRTEIMLEDEQSFCFVLADDVLHIKFEDIYHDGVFDGFLIGENIKKLKELLDKYDTIKENVHES